MKRAQFDTAIWHVMARGTRRLELFREPGDYREFLQILVFALKKAGATIWAYVLMNNHYHFLIEAGSRRLAGCMHRLNKMYALYHNKRYGLVGHLFDGPYKAFPQKTPLLSLATIGYIFANPVKAGICDTPADYAWSSYRSFVGLPGSPLRIDPTPFLARLDPDPDKLWRLFHRGLERELHRPMRLYAGQLRMDEVHLSQFAWLLDHARASSKLLRGEDPMEVAVHWGRRSGITPRVMAKVLGMKDSRSVRNLLIAFKKRLHREPHLAFLATVP
jgi:putative transposase